MKSNKPFRETVHLLLEVEDISMREMVRRGENSSDDPRTMGAVQPVLAGRAEPSIGLMEFCAKALRIEPETFAEYRMWQARRLFDPTDEDVGFETALKNLEALERRAKKADLPLPAGWLADRQAGKGTGPRRAESA